MCQSNTLQAGRLGGPLLCSLVASLHHSRLRKRGKEKSGRLGWRIRTPTWWGCKGGRERGAGLRQRPPPRCRLRAAVNPGGGGRLPSRASWAQEPESRRERERAVQPPGAVQPPARVAAASPSAPATAAAAVPAAPQQSVRLLLQLPRVEGLRGGKARRREGWGGMKAAPSLPRGGGRGWWGGAQSFPPPESAARTCRGRQPAGQSWGGGAEGRGAEIPRGTEINKFGAQATGQLLPPLRASWFPPPSSLGRG